jgi:hypothetical protein
MAHPDNNGHQNHPEADRDLARGVQRPHRHCTAYFQVNFLTTIRYIIMKTEKGSMSTQMQDHYTRLRPNGDVRIHPVPTMTTALVT